MPVDKKITYKASTTDLLKTKQDRHYLTFSSHLVPDAELTLSAVCSPSSSSLGSSCWTGSKAACFGRAVLRPYLSIHTLYVEHHQSHSSWLTFLILVQLGQIAQNRTSETDGETRYFTCWMPLQLPNQQCQSTQASSATRHYPVLIHELTPKLTETPAPW